MKALLGCDVRVRCALKSNLYTTSITQSMHIYPPRIAGPLKHAPSPFLPHLPLSQAFPLIRSHFLSLSLSEHFFYASALDLAGGDEDVAQQAETTILTLFLSWKMGAQSFGEISKEVQSATICLGCAGDVTWGSTSYSLLGPK